MNNTESNLDNEYYLELSNDPVRFECFSQVPNVFFDDSKQQVFAVRSGGVTSVNSLNQSFHFKMEDKGLVISIKFSPAMNILAIQRTQTSVEFVNYSTSAGLDIVEYSQSCKSKNASILGFVWTHGNEILLITDHGVELFMVNPAKRNVKALKSLSLGVNWYLYSYESSMILLSSGTIGNQMQALHITPGNIQKITKFEMDATAIKSDKYAVQVRDVALAVLYGIPCIIVLRHQHHVDAHRTGSTHVCVYTVHKMISITQSYTFKLDMRGRFALNVVDNLIIVHHQESKSSMIFDIMLGGVSDGTVMHLNSVAIPKQIKPFSLKVQGATLSEQISQSCPLYSENWVLFQPNIIIDIGLGCLWYIELRLEALTKLITDKVKLVEFLIQRKDGKPILLQVLQNYVNDLPKTLVDIPAIFDKINAVCRIHLENELQSQMATPIQSTTKNSSNAIDNFPYKLQLDQIDMYTHILSKFTGDVIEPKMIIWVLLEYIRSLAEHGIPVQHLIHEIVITTLVNRKAYYQLHQLLQYHVVADSKPLACLLLSLENLYPAAHQLALDMLKRLGNAHEEIIEVLLSKGQILSALRYVRSVGMVDQVSARKFLEAAKATNEPILFHSVYKFFEQRNLRLHNTTAFTRCEHCQSYVDHYENLFRGIGNASSNSTMTSSISTIASQD